MNALVQLRPDFDAGAELARYDAACRAIQEASSVDELSNISDVARAMRAAAHILDNRKSEVDWSEVHLRAERRLGALIKTQRETVGLRGAEHSRGGGSKGSKREPLPDAPPTLSDAGIDKKLSSRSQQLAEVPEHVIEQAVVRAREKMEPVSVGAILREHRTGERRARDRAERVQAQGIDASFSIQRCAIEDVTSAMVGDDSVEAIITDPPYPKEFLPLFSDLGSFAARVLKPGGWCVVMTGAVFLPEVINRLCASLTYRWQYVVTTPGGASVRMGRLGLFQGYKPVLLFQKPPVSKIREAWSDVITAKAGDQDKSLHPWQQSEPVFAELVKRFSRPGDLVVDPFAGSGTTGRAAVSQGRHFWGCDIDEKCATRVAP